MSKIFRLGAEGSQNNRDWQDSKVYPYNQNNRQTIEDPDGASAHNEITSIPSPFARIDLVKNAFARVSESRNLDGNTIFHKMVSDALDIGEIFFNFDKLKDQIEIITWDVQKEIEILKQSTHNGHQYLGDALQKYLQSDAETYNFGELQNIYLLNYINGPQPLNIIGATSPATLFFSNANDLNYVGKTIQFGTDKPFDKEYNPLYKRDFEYVKFWFYLRETLPDFAIKFRELDNYLGETYERIVDNQKRAELRDIVQNMQGLSPISIDSTNQVEVLGVPLLKKSVELQAGVSQFEIRSSRYTKEDKPLVLPVERGITYSNLLYTTDKWGKENYADFIDHEPDLSLRHLPKDGTKHPYLTISDFLEDAIIRVPHGLNDSYFFDGNFKEANSSRLSYLLPLKPRFFEFFSADELVSGIDEKTSMLEIRETGNGVKVILRIPIIGDNRVRYVEYSRLYFGGNVQADPERNEGVILDFRFTGFIMPNIRFANPEEAIYRVSCISDFKLNYTLRFYEGSQPIEAEIDCRNKDISDNLKPTTYSIEKRNFEYIQLVDDYDMHRGVLLPLFSKQYSGKQFKVSIDLGTSNTHLEYMANGDLESRTFSYNPDELVTRFFIPKDVVDGKIYNDLEREDAFLNYDYFPLLLGKDSNSCFPTRTVLSHVRDIDWTTHKRPLGLINIPFTFYSFEGTGYNEQEENVKWGEDNKLVTSYIECMALMIRTFLVSKGASLSKTELTWFYPISMPPVRVNTISDAWDDVANKYFGISKTKRMTESLAPIRFFFTNNATATNLVNIDIGGGTTDIAFAQEQHLKFVTSFKFAANDLYESSLDQNPHNGIIDTFKPLYHDLLSSDGQLGNLVEVLQKMHRPSSVASFLFSLANNKEAEQMNADLIDFSKRLRMNEKGFKIVFLLFYTGIIYHIGQILKLKDLPMPRHISFSGNGSKTLNIISTQKADLTRFTQAIFTLLNVKGSDGKLELLGLEKDSSPKLATCKGGLLCDSEEDDYDKVVKLRADGKGFVGNDDTYESIDSAYIDQAKKAVEEFFDFFFNKLVKEFDVEAYFGVSRDSLKQARSATLSDLDTYIRRGIALSCESSNKEEKIAETLFFYPLKGVINVLSANIAEQNLQLKNNK